MNNKIQSPPDTERLIKREKEGERERKRDREGERGRREVEL